MELIRTDLVFVIMKLSGSICMLVGELLKSYWSICNEMNLMLPIEVFS